MRPPINWKDEYFVSKDRIVLTNNELQIPGVRMFATHKTQNAIPPLLPHYHENAFEFTLVVKGSMSFYADDKEYTLYGGNVFVSFPDEAHSTNDIPISLNQMYWMQIDISDPYNFLYLNENVAEELIHSLLEIDKHVIETDNQQIRYIIEKAFELTANSDNKLLISNYICIFLQLLISFSKENQYHSSPDIETVINFIHEHITEELSLDDLALLCGLSTSQFKQKFRHVVGISPRNYINQEKITCAKKLLKEGCSVTDTAMRLGFNSSSYFSTVFKKYTMEIPREYVLRHQ